MRHLTQILATALAFSACSMQFDSWDHYIDGPLWDASQAVAREDGLYVTLPRSGGLVRLDPAGKGVGYRSIDIGEGRAVRLSGSPDGASLIAFIDRYRCDVGDDSAPVFQDECDEDDLVVETELNVIRDGNSVGSVAIDGPYNRLAYARNGRFGIAYLDFEDEDLKLTGVVNLNAVIAIDIEEGTATPISVGFAADHVLFVEDDELGATQAVVLSRNSVAVIDLLANPPQREVTFPLTLDPDVTVVPVGVELTPDGRYALISVEDSSDLYAIDLISQSINIVELSSSPADMIVDAKAERTVLVFDRRASVDVLEHEYFDIESYTLDEAMDSIVAGDGFSLLWSQSGAHDVYRLNLEDNSLVEYRLQNPAIEMALAPGEEFAVALTRAENGFNDGVEGVYDRSPGMEILDLRSDDTQPFLLEGNGLGIAFSSSETELHALVLQQGVEYLYQLDLYTGVALEIDLSSPPVAIGTMEDGSFYITHESALGLVSFLDPVTGKIQEVGGFGAHGLMDGIELIDNGADQ
jgi:hypothetical protein